MYPPAHLRTPRPELRVFLEDLRVSPHDLNLRRILADWLDDQENPEDAARAELLRLQCAQAEFPRRIPRLSRREAVLLAEWYRQWLGPLADLAQPWQFEHGRLQLTLSCHVFQTPHFSDLWKSEAFAWTDCLTLTNATPGTIAHLAGMPALGGLRELVVQEGRVGNNGFAVLADSPHLRELRVLRLPMTGIGGRVPGPLHMPHLETLDLSQNYLRDIDLANLLQVDLPAVRHLHLGYNNLSDRAMALLALSPLAAGLETLNLIGNRRLGDVGLGWLAITRLKRLDVSQSTPTDVGLQALGRMSELEELALDRCELGDERFKAFAFAEGAKKLHTLRAGRALLGDESLIALLTSRTQAWKSLRLPYNHLGPRSIQVLAESPTIGQLRELNLAGNRLDDRCAQLLARSPYLSRLQLLDVSENPLTPVGLGTLIRRFGSTVVTQ
ncbi:MAG: TIGR02996 domain-containing protein [Gemmataceae bacterium]